MIVQGTVGLKVDLRPVPPGHKVCAYCSQIVPREAHGMSCEERPVASPRERRS